MKRDYKKLSIADTSYLYLVEFKNSCVECEETGHVYKDAKYACIDNGLSYYRMNRHLLGEVPSLKGLHFKYTDKLVKE